MLFFRNSAASLETNRVIYILFQIVSCSSGILQWQSVSSSFPYFHRVYRPFHFIANNRIFHTRITIIVWIWLIIPYKRSTILHIIRFHQVLCRTGRCLSTLHSNRKISLLKVTALTCRTIQYHLSFLIINVIKYLRIRNQVQA